MGEMAQDVQWLRTFVTEGCEKSFAALVQHYQGLVYSAALRQVQDSTLAEEVAQAVFVILARKARTLPQNVVLAGWLFRTTRFVASHAVRDRRRRLKYEKEAAAMNPHEPAPRSAWDDVAPVLDEALARLGATDRHAILLRFFEQKHLKEVGSALGTTEEAARKRVARALDKLHLFLTRRGTVLSVTGLATALTANAVQAAPAHLFSAITATVAAKGGSTATLLLINSSMKAMLYAKLQPFAICGAGLLLVASLGGLFAQQAKDPRVLFEDTFEDVTLAQWTGNLHGVHHGTVVADPLRPQNRVLTFTELSANGDVFSAVSIPVANTSQQYILSFDYLGLSPDGSRNLGGFLGLAASVDDWEQGRIWVAGTDPTGISPPSGVLLSDDSEWHHYEIDLSSWIQQNNLQSFHLMMEDWRDRGGVPGDVYFDNIRLVTGSRHEPRLQVHVTEVTACWDSQPNQNYQLQYRSPRTPGGWVNVGSPVLGTGGTNCLADPIPLNEPQRFYRVVNVP
jgi:RNA polymerase sigma factor (sigma-70 family)